MCRSRVADRTRMLAGLASLLFAMVAIPSGAQTAPTSEIGRGFGPVYDAAQERVIEGTVEEVITQHALGSPAGLRVRVAGLQGAVDAHLGPFLSKETKEALYAGAPVRILGAMAVIHDQQYLLARELTVGGRRITIRNARGFLLYPRGDGSARSKAISTAVENGGSR